MSSILEALKKAQIEEKEKKEKGADRVVYLMPKNRLAWVQGVRRWAAVAGMLSGLVLCAAIGVKSLGMLSNRAAKPAVIAAKTQETAEAASTGKFHLTGILWDEKEPFAIINAEMVREGDRVGDAVVASISQTGVELLRDQNLQVLSLEKD